VIGVGFTIFSMLPTIAFGAEKRFQPSLGEMSNNNVVAVFVSIFTAFRTMPKPLIKVVAVFFLSWYALVV
jgi:hypothetical protein